LYYRYDALGNVVGVIDSGYYTSYEQDAFGNRIPGSTSWQAMNDPGPKEHLTGKMYDTTTNLYCFHARWYDPEVGRFISRDKVEEHSNYTFVSSNPCNKVDPSGHMLIVPEFPGYPVRLCGRKAALGCNILGFQHWWIEIQVTTVGTKTIGMGLLDRQGEAGSCCGLGTDVVWRAHGDQSDKWCIQVVHLDGSSLSQEEADALWADLYNVKAASKKNPQKYNPVTNNCQCWVGEFLRSRNLRPITPAKRFDPPPTGPIFLPVCGGY